MSELNDFNTTLYDLCEKKVSLFDSTILPTMLDNYRTFHTAVTNIISMLEKKKILVPDPYKRDKRVVDIEIPPNDDFSDSEGPTIFGTRFSDYETSLDFLCNYMQFNVNAMPAERIKKLFAFNSFLDWTLSTSGGPNSNIRFFSNIVTGIRTGSDTLSSGLLSNMLSLCAKQIKDINTELRNLTALQREIYKIDVRKKLLDNPGFANTYSSLTIDNGLQEVKKAFQRFMGSARFYPDLIDEIINEDFSSSKDSIQKALLDKFQVKSESKKEVKNSVNTRAQLNEVVKILAGFGPSLEVVVQKLEENHELLQGENKGAFDKFMRALRALLKKTDSEVEYKIKAIDMLSQVEKAETIEYNKFMDSMIQRSKIFKALSSKESPLVQKLSKESEEAVLGYVQKRISDCQNLHGILVGFDAFFKAEVMPENRSKVKGLLVDLDVIKNTIMKANKYKAEYVSTVTTEKQMEKLGITDV